MHGYRDGWFYFYSQVFSAIHSDRNFSMQTLIIFRLILLMCIAELVFYCPE